MFPSAIIKKGKPSNKNKAKKVDDNDYGLLSADTLDGENDNLSTADVVTAKPFVGADTIRSDGSDLLKSISSSEDLVRKATSGSLLKSPKKEPKKEDIMELDLSLHSAKKKPKPVSAEFTPVEERKGKLVEANSVRQKYLNKISKR